MDSEVCGVIRILYNPSEDFRLEGLDAGYWMARKNHEVSVMFYVELVH